MTKETITRRNFVGKSALGLSGAIVTASSSAMSAASYNRISGANDRINIAFVAWVLAWQIVRGVKV